RGRHHRGHRGRRGSLHLGDAVAVAVPAALEVVVVVGDAVPARARAQVLLGAHLADEAGDDDQRRDHAQHHEHRRVRPPAAAAGRRRVLQRPRVDDDARPLASRRHR
uniref:Uncharacterized protein n=1 Tax=Triticum urartu TaxID=4572 RepID=A0A8R7P827_TRIUA